MKSLLIVGPLLLLGILALVNRLMTRRDLRRFSGRSLEQVAHLRAGSAAFIDTVALLVLSIILDATGSLAYTWTIPVVLAIALIDAAVRRAVLIRRARGH